MTKFCRHNDEQTDAQVGGMTICECITYICTCGDAMEPPVGDTDEYLKKYAVDEDEEEGDVAQEEEQEEAEEADLESKVITPEVLVEEENIAYEEDDGENVFLMDKGNDVPPTARRGDKRGCCTRLICLICCCDTNDIGSQAHLNRLNEEEIQIYHRQLSKEIENAQKKSEEIRSNDDKPGMANIPPLDIASQKSKGSKNTEMPG